IPGRRSLWPAWENSSPRRTSKAGFFSARIIHRGRPAYNQPRKPASLPNPPPTGAVMFFPRRVSFVLIAFFAPLLAAPGAEPGPSEEKAEPAIKPLLARVESGGDAVKLRQDLLAFRQAHAGTRAAVRAAECLR